MLTASQAYTLASQWGSYISAGDPGACFYSFHQGDARPVDEPHRAACLAYLEMLLARTPESIDRVELRWLAKWFTSAPLYADPISACVMATGISYANRTREEHGDFKRLAFLPFNTLSLEFRADCPRELREAITELAKPIQAQRGKPFQVSTSGQTVILGR